jgi:sulfhydrogenase subunit gamma (sulfur reductase)
MPERAIEPRQLRVVNAARRTDAVWLFTFDAADGRALDLDFVPGQVAVLSIPDIGEAYMAIASPPGARGIVEFLIKRSGEVGERVCDLGHEANVRLVRVVGHGFPVDDFEGKDLVFVAAGTAIAPVRSAIAHSVTRRGKFRRIVLVHCVRRPEDFAVDDELDHWREAGVNVHLTVTQPGASCWTGPVGRVQHLLAKAIDGLTDPVAFVVGSDEMMRDTTEALAELGVPRERILKNY